MAMNYKRLGGKREPKTPLAMTVGNLVTPDNGNTIWVVVSRTRSTITAEHNGTTKEFSPIHLTMVSV